MKKKNSKKIPSNQFLKKQVNQLVTEKLVSNLKIKYYKDKKCLDNSNILFSNQSESYNFNNINSINNLNTNSNIKDSYNFNLSQNINTNLSTGFNASDIMVNFFTKNSKKEKIPNLLNFSRKSRQPTSLHLNPNNSNFYTFTSHGSHNKIAKNVQSNLFSNKESKIYDSIVSNSLENAHNGLRSSILCKSLLDISLNRSKRAASKLSKASKDSIIEESFDFNHKYKDYIKFKQDNNKDKSLNTSDTAAAINFSFSNLNRNVSLYDKNKVMDKYFGNLLKNNKNNMINIQNNMIIENKSFENVATDTNYQEDLDENLDERYNNKITYSKHITENTDIVNFNSFENINLENITNTLKASLAKEEIINADIIKENEKIRDAKNNIKKIPKGNVVHNNIPSLKKVIVNNINVVKNIDKNTNSNADRDVEKNKIKLEVEKNFKKNKTLTKIFSQKNLTGSNNNTMTNSDSIASIFNTNKVKKTVVTKNSKIKNVKAIGVRAIPAAVKNEVAPIQVINNVNIFDIRISNNEITHASKKTEVEKDESIVIEINSANNNATLITNGTEPKKKESLGMNNTNQILKEEIIDNILISMPPETENNTKNEDIDEEDYGNVSEFEDANSVHKIYKTNVFVHNPDKLAIHKKELDEILNPYRYSEVLNKYLFNHLEENNTVKDLNESKVSALDKDLDSLVYQRESINNIKQHYKKEIKKIKNKLNEIEIKSETEIEKLQNLKEKEIEILKEKLKEQNLIQPNENNNLTGIKKMQMELATLKNSLQYKENSYKKMIKGLLSELRNEFPEDSIDQEINDLLDSDCIKSNKSLTKTDRNKGEVEVENAENDSMLLELKEFKEDDLGNFKFEIPTKYHFKQNTKLTNEMQIDGKLVKYYDNSIVEIITKNKTLTRVIFIFYLIVIP